MPPYFRVLPLVICLLGALPSSAWAKIPLTYADVFTVLGQPDVPPHYSGGPKNGQDTDMADAFIDYAKQYPSDLVIHKGVLAIMVHPSSTGEIVTILFDNGMTMGDMDIQAALSLIPTDEKWVRKDPHTWILGKAGAKAVWDGGSKLLMTNHL